MRLYEIFEEDTSNLLAMARWAMEEHPDKVKEHLGITHEYYVKLIATIVVNPLFGACLCRLEMVV